MTLVKFNNRPMYRPFSPFFDEMFNNERCNCAPATNIAETNESFIIEMFVPGMEKSDFNLKLEKEILTVSSEKEANTDENVRYTRREFSASPFSRSFTMPKTVDLENITADYNNGILKVVLPKKEDARVALSRNIPLN